MASKKNDPIKIRRDVHGEITFCYRLNGKDGSIAIPRALFEEQFPELAAPSWVEIDVTGWEKALAFLGNFFCDRFCDLREQRPALLRQHNTRLKQSIITLQGKAAESTGPQAASLLEKATRLQESADILDCMENLDRAAS